jgi:D-glycero-alpha-D-manno-heptose 1-phosphate guanylyltransferase
MNRTPSDVPVIILVGGLGTRLRPVVSDRPKALARIGEKTILDLIIEHLSQQGFRHYICSVGYMKGMVKEHVFLQDYGHQLHLSFSEEDEPLGTGGAIKRAMNLTSQEPVLVLNGDTFFPIDYRGFVANHFATGADASLGLKIMEGDTSRYGTVELNESGRIIRFVEKHSGQATPHVSAGVYMLDADIFADKDLPDKFSIEKDFFEKHMHTTHIVGVPFTEYFIDIGTPESYEQAQRELGKL